MQDSMLHKITTGGSMAAQPKTPKFVQAGDGAAFEVLGATMLYKATAEDTGGGFSLAVETTAPGGGQPLHFHSQEDEAMYILEGEFEIQCGDNIVKATAGSFAFLPRGVPNRYQNIGDTAGKFVYVTSPGGSEKLVAEASKAQDPESAFEIAKKYGIKFL
jgi:mannose-6-phosphate isomerase-like protein (cupin superfamily)